MSKPNLIAAPFANAGCIAVAAGALMLASTGAVAAPIFHVSGPATTAGGHEGDALLTGVSFGSASFGADDFIYTANVSNVTYTGALGQFRIASGPKTSKTDPDPRVNTTSFQPIETLDGDGTSVSAEDRRLFANEIRDAFRNRNLNNYVDLIDPGESYALTVTFASELVDNDPGADDDVGELLYFERGFGGSNSYVMIGLDNDGQPVGSPLTVMAGQVVIDPRDESRFSPLALTPRTEVSIYDSAGNVIGAQEMEGLALDLSEAFGVDRIRSVRVSVPPGELVGVGPGGHYDTAPDIKLIGLDTGGGVPEPAALGLLMMGGALLGRRRSR